MVVTHWTQKIASSKPIMTLLKFRFHWYRQKTFEKLMRAKHGLIIFMALFVQNATFFIFLMTEPVLSIIHPNSLGVTFFLKLAAFHIIYLGWILWQRDAVRPANIQSYLNSMPLSKKMHFYLDLIMVLIANNIFWLPLIITYFTVFQSHNPDKTLLLMRLCALVMSVVTLQVMVLRLSNLHFINPAAIQYVNNYFAKRFPLLTLLTWQFTTLWRNYSNELIMRLLISSGIIACAYALTQNGNIPVLQISIVATSMVLFILSGIYPLLKEARDSCHLYFKSLPFNELNWFMLDYRLLLIMTFLMSGVYILLLSINHAMSKAVFTYAILSLLPTGILLGYIRNTFPKQGTLISTICIITIIWYLL